MAKACRNIMINRTVLLIGILLLSVSALFPQQPKQEPPCPNIALIGPPVVIMPGETMTFRLKVEDVEVYKSLKIEWKVNRGEIIEVINGSEILVGETDLLAGETIEAVATVAGLPKGCESTLTETGIVATSLSCHPIDEFGSLSRDDLKSRVDNLFISLQSDPQSTTHIVIYGPPEEVSSTREIILGHIESRELPVDRVFVEYRDVEKALRVRMWIIPPGADTECIN